MVFAFKFPDLGEGIREGKIVKWLVKEGDAVKADQVIAEVETDKAVVELPSPAKGNILKRYFGEGEIVHVGQVVVAIGEAGETAPAAEVEAEKQAPATEHAKVVPIPDSQAHHVQGETHKLHVTVHGERPVEEKSEQTTTLPQASAATQAASAPVTQTTAASASPASSQVLATPATRALARELGVNLSLVKGSGPGGRVMPEDVRKFSQGGASTSVATGAGASASAAGGALAALQSQLGVAVPSGAAQVSSSSGTIPVEFQYPKISFPAEGVERVALSPIRRAIVAKMSESKRWIPHVTHSDEADVTRLEEIRSAAKGQAEGQGVKLTMLPFVAKAVVNALKQFPVFNSSLDYQKQELVLKKFYNLGFAVDTPEGLIVVNIKNAESKSIMDFAREIPVLAEKARERKASLDEIRGGTFTITNIGSVGGVGATPIINFPEAAILGVFRAKHKPVVADGKIVVRKIMPLCVSFDHRIIDGAEAARFVQFIVKQLEDPTLL